MDVPHPTHHVCLYFTSAEYITPTRDEVLFGIVDLVATVLGIESQNISPSISLSNARAILPLVVPQNKLNNLEMAIEKLAQKLKDEGKLRSYEIIPATT